MQAECITDIEFFTKGEIYSVTHIDADGDIWVEADDEGHPMFFYPRECRLIED